MLLFRQNIFFIDSSDLELGGIRFMVLQSVLKLCLGQVAAVVFVIED